MPDSGATVLRRWFPAFLQALAHQPQVLVTVVHARGSVPRDTGARMWVGNDQVTDTIGGGNLEWQAIDRARQWLRHGGSAHALDSVYPDRTRDRQAVCASGRREVVRYPLGPRLGQCCGGAVWLMFEWLDAADQAWCQSLYQALQANQAVARTLDFSSGTLQLCFDVPHPSVDTAPAYQPGALRFTDVFQHEQAVVVVCGACHVGQAIVRLLGDLPFRVIWLDPREQGFPASLPDNVQCVAGDADDVIDLPDDAFWLVLTHNHALDLQLIEAVLQHRRTRFLGMIGSQTKLASFRSRLARRFPPEQLERIQCPIGCLPVRSKEPAIIAVSVAAQLLALTAQ